MGLLEQDRVFLAESKHQALLQVVYDQSGQFSVIYGKVKQGIHLGFLAADVHLYQTSNFHPHISREEDLNIFVR